MISIRAETGFSHSEIISFTRISELIRKVRVKPYLKMKNSEHEYSIWIIILLGLVTGFLTGFLGVGGGFVRVPLLIYVLGMPTVMAVGTDLLEIVFSAGFGCSHAQPHMRYQPL